MVRTGPLSGVTNTCPCRVDSLEPILHPVKQQGLPRKGACHSIRTLWSYSLHLIIPMPGL